MTDRQWDSNWPKWPRTNWAGRKPADAVLKFPVQGEWDIISENMHPSLGLCQRSWKSVMKKEGMYNQKKHSSSNEGLSFLKVIICPPHTHTHTYSRVVPQVDLSIGSSVELSHKKRVLQQKEFVPSFNPLPSVHLCVWTQHNTTFSSWDSGAHYRPHDQPHDWHAANCENQVNASHIS